MQDRRQRGESEKRQPQDRAGSLEPFQTYLAIAIIPDLILYPVSEKKLRIQFS